ncbi:glycosyltransferase [Pseudomonas sp.]|uniref:glycosyltransferase n=1 Tax=Pseudomonas sp. TaxID=306 RepID=UPI003FD86DEA
MFSVLMCCNRDDGFLDEALQSVLKQTYEDFEFLIILNNCSDELYKKILNVDDPRIVVHRTKIGQLSFNLNYGINLASRAYIVRFDADDICHPDRLKETHKILTSDSEIDIIAGSCRLINDKGAVIGNVDLSKSLNWRSVLLRKNPFIHPALALRTDLIIKSRGYMGGFHSEDYELWLRMSDNENIKVAFTNFQMIDYRISEHQARGSKLGYAEVASYFLKRALLKPTLKNGCSVILSLYKFYFKGENK